MTISLLDRNPLIKCACGCGKVMLKFDREGKQKKYAPGHNILKIPDDAVLTLMGDRAWTVRQVATALNCSHSTINRMFKRLKDEKVIVKLKGTYYYCKFEYREINRDRLNPWVNCACGCGGRFRKFDANSRRRRFLRGHNKDNNFKSYGFSASGHEQK